MSKRFYGQRLDGPTVDGRVLHAGVFNEVQVRIAAGITMGLGAIAFSFSNWEKVYWPIQIVTTFFFIDFLIRVTVGIHRSPVGLVSDKLTRGQAPQWVSAKPKRFAWTLGMAMSFAMMVITNSGIRGTLPRTICLICLALMWLESVLGLCAGCEMHAFMVRRGWVEKDEDYEICAGGVCDLPVREAPTTEERRVRPLVAATRD